MRRSGISLPPIRWTRSDFAGLVVWLGIFFGPWLVIAAVVLGILWAAGVLR